MAEEKNVIAAVAETLANAVQDSDFVLPLAFMQAGSPQSDEINAAYAEEIEAYRASWAEPCDKKAALKLLKRFARKDFGEFWAESVADYLPAVSEGTMKLCERVYPHAEALRRAKDLIATLSVKELAKDFLYGVAHNAPEYRTALACYYYIKNLPEHEFEKKYIGSVVGKDGEMKECYSESVCEICGYGSALCSEPKMQFYSINVDMERFYFDGRMGRSSLNDAILFLEEYQKLPRPDHSVSDYEVFQKVIAVIEATPENMTSGKLRRELKQSGLLKMTLDQLEVLINTLGYLDILHSDDSHGMLYSHTRLRDMLFPLSDRGYAEHPVNRWTRKCGIDYNSISFLFDGIW